MKTGTVGKSIIGVAAALVMMLETVLPVNAMTVYESDGVYHEEGYIFVGESHSVASASAVGMHSDVLGDDISYIYQMDSSREITESGGANTFTMKGNLFFVFEGNTAADGRLQTSKEYIYSNGGGVLRDAQCRKYMRL